MNYSVNFVKIRDTLHEIMIVIRPHIRQYSYDGFMQIKLANYLVYRNVEDTVMSGNCTNHLAQMQTSTCTHWHASATACWLVTVKPAKKHKPREYFTPESISYSVDISSVAYS